MERIKVALSSRYFLICIDGIGGIGKTSLALEVIHECLRFSKGEIPVEAEKEADSAIPQFDGFIWTSAKDRELRLNDILDAVARTLDWPGIAQQPYEEKIESVRKLLQAIWQFFVLYRLRFVCVFLQHHSPKITNNQQGNPDT